MQYSVVIPIHNEEGNIFHLDKEIRQVMKKIGEFEVIYVDDGSTDNSIHELRKLKNAKVLELNRNYGQATALDAGFKASTGEIVISMDGDMQNDPKDIPKMLEKLEKDDLDVVCGWRKKRKDKAGVKVLTRIGRLLRRILIKDKVHDTGCTLRVYRKKAIESLDIGGEMHRYILALLRWKGFRVGEIVVNHRKRLTGETKYGYSKAVRGFIDLLHIWFIEKYYQRPLHVFGSLGILSLIGGFGIEAWMIYQKIFNTIDLSANAWFLLGFFLIMAGIMLFSFGLIIDILMKTYLNTSKEEKRYYVRHVWKAGEPQFPPC